MQEVIYSSCPSSELLLSNLCLEAVEPSPFRNGVCFHSLWVLSPSVIIGYFQDAKRTLKVFKVSYFSADETGHKFGRSKYIALFCDWGGKAAVCSNVMFLDVESRPGIFSLSVWKSFETVSKEKCWFFSSFLCGSQSPLAA